MKMYAKNRAETKLKKTVALVLSFFAFVFLGGQLAFSGYSSNKATQPKSASIRLVMIEEDGCPYCRAWMEDVGNAYDKTAEGKFAPLTRVDTREAKAQFKLNVHFTPTFVVLKDGKEVGRLIGYIDDSFFWPKLDTILGKMGYKDPS